MREQFAHIAADAGALAEGGLDVHADLHRLPLYATGAQS
jgi:hypothetical protein